MQQQQQREQQQTQAQQEHKDVGHNHDLAIKSLTEWLRSSPQLPNEKNTPSTTIDGYMGYPDLVAEEYDRVTGKIPNISSRDKPSTVSPRKEAQKATPTTGITIPPLILPPGSQPTSKRKSPKRRLLTPRNKAAPTSDRRSLKTTPLNKDPDIVYATNEQMHIIRRANMTVFARKLDELGTQWDYKTRILTVPDLINSKIKISGALAYGFETWSQILKGGITLEHLKRDKWLDPITLSCVYGVTGQQLHSDLKFSIGNVIQENLTPSELQMLSITTDTLFQMGMQSGSFLRLSFSLGDWIDKLGMNYTHLERLGYDYQTSMILTRTRPEWDPSRVDAMFPASKKVCTNTRGAYSSPAGSFKQNTPSANYYTRRFTNIYHGGPPGHFSGVEDRKDTVIVPVRYSEPDPPGGIMGSTRDHLAFENDLDLLGPRASVQQQQQQPSNRVLAAIPGSHAKFVHDPPQYPDLEFVFTLPR